jgi:hypothetical protein
MKPAANVVLSAIAVVAAAGVGFVQPRIAATMHAVKEREDVYVLPPPGELRVMSLGYRNAGADLLWAKLLVQYGTHWAEKREFPDLPRYLDAILALEPDYAPLYKFADTLIVYRPPRGTEADVRIARRFLERGIRERPFDHDVWHHYGQFLAFLAPSFLTSKEETDRWRKEGAEALFHAVDLGADPDAAISAATLLNRFGEHKATIENLRRAYALTDDPNTRTELSQKLERLEATAEREMAERDMKFIESRWRKDYPFISRGEYLMIAPFTDPLRCTGPKSGFSLECGRAWEPRLPSAKP